jgi:hypothetical protein
LTPEAAVAAEGVASQGSTLATAAARGLTLVTSAAEEEAVDRPDSAAEEVEVEEGLPCSTLAAAVEVHLCSILVAEAAGPGPGSLCSILAGVWAEAYTRSHFSST